MYVIGYEGAEYRPSQFQGTLSQGQPIVFKRPDTAYLPPALDWFQIIQPQPWSAPLSRELLVFNSFIRSLSRSLRTLLEVTSLNMLLRGDVRRARDDLLDITLSLPFQTEVNTGFGILAKVYLDALTHINGGQRVRDPNGPGIKDAKSMALEICEDTFTGIKYPRTEVERGFRFWDVVSVFHSLHRFPTTPVWESDYSREPLTLTCPSGYHLGIDCDEAVAFRKCGVTRVGGSVRGSRSMVGSHETLNLKRIDSTSGFPLTRQFFRSHLIHLTTRHLHDDLGREENDTRGVYHFRALVDCERPLLFTTNIPTKLRCEFGLSLPRLSTFVVVCVLCVSVQCIGDSQLRSIISAGFGLVPNCSASSEAVGRYRHYLSVISSSLGHLWPPDFQLEGGYMISIGPRCSTHQ